MRKKTYRVQLTAEEEKQLKDITRKGVHTVRQIIRARILPLLNEKTEQEGKPAKIPEQTTVRMPYYSGISSKQTIRAGKTGTGTEPEETGNTTSTGQSNRGNSGKDHRDKLR
jgi:hypothetical protein